MKISAAHATALLFLLLLGSGWLALGALAQRAQAADGEPEQFFETQVRPILAEHCSECHGGEKQFGGLRLDSLQSMLSGSDSAPVLIAGDADNSLLIQAIRREGGLEMPPEERLSAAQIEILTHWVNTGAPWPQGEPLDEAQIAEQARTHWAFQRVKPQPLPPVQQSDWVQMPVDAFVLAELEARQLTPSPPADKETLVRRASYVLTGLPPTPAQVQQFTESSDPKVYENLIESLLASPHYGEHWARHWLDVARYSDTKGYVYAREERFWTHAWTYRDWVVDALNRDRPYDEFLLMQLAADQVAQSPKDLAPKDLAPKNLASKSLAPENLPPDDLAAMGYLTLGRRFLGVKHDIIDDRIDVVCRGMMALTVTCARCHDHKFDPIPTADYYSLYGVFDSCIEAEQSLSAPDELDAAYLTELRKRQQTLTDRLTEVRGESAARVRDRVIDYLGAQFEKEKYPAETFGQLFRKTDLLPSIVRRWESYLQRADQRRDPVFVPWHSLTQLVELPEAEFADRARVICDELQKEDPSQVNPLVAAAFREPPSTAEQVAVIYGTLLTRIRQQAVAAAGSDAAVGSLGEIVLDDPHAQALLHVLYGPGSPCELPDESIVELETFLDIASCEQLWKLQGEVDRWIIQSPAADRRARTLLDRAVATEPRVFRRGNPLRKEQQVPRHFLTLLSEAQPQPFTRGSGRLELAQAIIDPENPLTARVLVNRVWGHYFGRPLVETPSDFGLRASPPSHPALLDYLAERFVAEGWRLKDLHRWILLSATFQQSDSGPDDLQLRARAHEIDPDNRLLWRWQPRRLSLEEMRDSLIAVTSGLDTAIGGKPVNLWQAPFSNRRTLYGLVDRQFLPGLLRVFDFANPDLHISQRSETTAPQQALFFLNHPLVLQQTRALSARLEATEDPRQRISELFRSVLLREPHSAEIADAMAFIAAAGAERGAPERTTSGQWSYGYGAVSEEEGRTTGFTPLPHFDGQAWQGGPQFPDATLGWVQLTAAGGHPGNDRAHAAVRRWTAPEELKIRIRSMLTHQPPQGDGIRAFIVHGAADSAAAGGILAQAKAHQQSVELNSDSLRIAAGQSIDFLVDIGDTLSHDQYLWHVTITGTAISAAAEEPQEVVWDSQADFTGHEAHRLDPWEQLAQVLLCTNEFLFVP